MKFQPSRTAHLHSHYRPTSDPQDVQQPPLTSMHHSPWVLTLFSSSIGNPPWLKSSRAGYLLSGPSLWTPCMLRKEKLKRFPLSLSKERWYKSSKISDIAQLPLRISLHRNHSLIPRPSFYPCTPGWFRKVHWVLYPALHDSGHPPHFFLGLPTYSRLFQASIPMPARWLLGRAAKTQP